MFYESGVPVRVREAPHEHDTVFGVLCKSWIAIMSISVSVILAMMITHKDLMWARTMRPQMLYPPKLAWTYKHEFMMTSKYEDSTDSNISLKFPPSTALNEWFFFDMLRTSSTLTHYESLKVVLTAVASADSYLFMLLPKSWLEQNLMCTESISYLQMDYKWKYFHLWLLSRCLLT